MRAGRDGGGEPVEGLSLLVAAEDQVQRRVVGRERAPRRGGVRRLRVVDPADAPALAHELEPVRNAGEVAQRRGDRWLPGAGRTRGRGRRGGVLAVVCAGERRLGR